MKIHHKITDVTYDVDCKDLNIQELKAHLCSIITGVGVDNIKLIKDCKELPEDDCLLYTYINMVIVPIKCNSHNE